MHGILLIDKPPNWTSHDVVARLRSILKTRRIGHAGTLDPLATGLLVIGVNEGTKLLAYLQNDSKVYSTRINFGAETDTLDSEGQVVERAALPEMLSTETLQDAANQFLGTHAQTVPIFSAVKRDGIALHKLARRGADVEAPTRDVDLIQVTVRDANPASATLELHCGKGFFVRSFARDLSRAIGTRGHVTALRRLRSGAFKIEDALTAEVLVPSNMEAKNQCEEKLLTLVQACAGIPQVSLDSRGEADASCGRIVSFDSIVSGPRLEDGTPQVACFSHTQKLLAIAEPTAAGLRIKRGFVGE